MAHRYYSQALSYFQRGRAVEWLLIANVSIYLVQLFAGRTFLYTFGLVPYQVTKNLWLWQIFTHMFLHGAPFHLLINLFVLWMFGKPIERAWGTVSFLKYYFTCGLGSGLFILLTSPSSRIPAIGASGAIYGILIAFAILYPDSIIYLYFFFPIKAKHFAVLIGAIAFLSGISGGRSNIAHFGHLGGLLIGYAYLKFDVWKDYLHTQELFSFLGHLKVSLRRREKYDIEERINEILDKILIKGIDSLTRKERRIMDEYSRRERH